MMIFILSQVPDSTRRMEPSTLLWGYWLLSQALRNGCTWSEPKVNLIHWPSGAVSFKLYVILEDQVPMSDLRWGGVTQALNWITNVFPEDIFTQFLFDRGHKCVVSVEGFYVKASLAMFSTKTRRGSAKILVRVRWFNNICICRWRMMIRIIVSSRSRPFFLRHKLVVFKEESRSPSCWSWVEKFFG